MGKFSGNLSKHFEILVNFYDVSLFIVIPYTLSKSDEITTIGLQTASQVPKVMDDRRKIGAFYYRFATGER